MPGLTWSLRTLTSSVLQLGTSALRGHQSPQFPPGSLMVLIITCRRATCTNAHACNACSHLLEFAPVTRLADPGNHTCHHDGAAGALPPIRGNLYPLPPRPPPPSTRLPFRSYWSPQQLSRKGCASSQHMSEDHARSVHSTDRSGAGAYHSRHVQRTFGCSSPVAVT